MFNTFNCSLVKIILIIIFSITIIPESDAGRRKSGKRFGIGFAQGVRPLIGEFEESNKRTIDHFTKECQNVISNSLEDAENKMNNSIENFGSELDEAIDNLDATFDKLVTQADQRFQKGNYSFYFNLRFILQIILTIGVFLIVLNFSLRKHNLKKAILLSVGIGALSYLIFYIIPDPITSDYNKERSSYIQGYDFALKISDRNSILKNSSSIAGFSNVITEDRYNKNQIKEKAKIISELLLKEYSFENHIGNSDLYNTIETLEESTFVNGYEDVDVYSIKSYYTFKYAENKKDEIVSALYAAKALKMKIRPILFEDVLYNILRIIKNYNYTDEYLRYQCENIFKEDEHESIDHNPLTNALLNDYLDSDNSSLSRAHSHIILYNELIQDLQPKVDFLYISMLIAIRDNFIANSGKLIPDQDFTQKIESIKESIEGLHKNLDIELEKLWQDKNNRHVIGAVLSFKDHILLRATDLCKLLLLPDLQKNVETNLNELKNNIKSLNSSIAAIEKKVSDRKNYTKYRKVFPSIKVPVFDSNKFNADKKSIVQLKNNLKDLNNLYSERINSKTYSVLPFRYTVMYNDYRKKYISRHFENDNNLIKYFTKEMNDERSIEFSKLELFEYYFITKGNPFKTEKGSYKKEELNFVLNYLINQGVYFSGDYNLDESAKENLKLSYFELEKIFDQTKIEELTKYFNNQTIHYVI